jgi:hypothetical protein
MSVSAPIKYVTNQYPFKTYKALLTQTPPLSDKRNLKLTEEDIQIRLQEIQSIRNTNKFARIVKK